MDNIDSDNIEYGEEDDFLDMLDTGVSGLLNDDVPDPEDIKFSWPEMIILTLVVIPADIASMFFAVTLVGIIFTFIINACVSVFVLFWLWFMKGGTGNRIIKRMIIKKLLTRWGVASVLGLTGIPTQSLVLFWMFLSARSKAAKIATKYIEHYA